MSQPKHLLLRPKLSEKSYALSQQEVYVMEVPITSHRNQIAAAVAEQFDVSVEAVRIKLDKGKRKRSVRKRVQPTTGQRKLRKFAYVRLKKGDAIPVFEEATS